MDTPGPGQPIIISEEWLAEWVTFGLANLAIYLTKIAQLDAWCAEHPDRKEPV